MYIRKAFVWVLCLAAGALVTQITHAEEGCVKNNGGYVAKITWWHADQVWMEVDSHGKATPSYAGSNHAYLQEKKPTLGFRPCAPSTWSADAGDLVTVSVAGSGGIEFATAVAADILVKAACYAGAAVATAETAGLAAETFALCKSTGLWLAGSATAAAAGVATGHALADAEEIFITTTIPKGCELRVAGTAFKPIYNVFKTGTKTICPGATVGTNTDA